MGNRSHQKKPSSMNELEWEKTIATISILTNELSELRKLRIKDKELIDDREGKVQNLSVLYFNEKAILKQRKGQISDLEKKILGLEQVIVCDQQKSNEVYASRKINELEKEKEECKRHLEEIEIEYDIKKENPTKPNIIVIFPMN